MKSASQFSVVLAVAVLMVAGAAPARAEMYPMQKQIQARQIIPCHALNTMMPAVMAEEPAIDTVINFAVNSDKLSPEAKVEVKRVAARLKSPEFAGAHIIVSGYTDSQGAAARNQRLSYHRALRVMHALIADGVPATMLSAQGFGKETPVATNTTGDGRSMNRRVSFMVAASAAD